MEYKWYKSSENLPPDHQICWVCDKDKYIYAARFECHINNSRWTPKGYITSPEPGFIIGEDDDNHIFLDQVPYWMPYYYPSCLYYESCYFRPLPNSIA